jgi:F-type H+-transporting ATPase subunit b
MTISTLEIGLSALGSNALGSNALAIASESLPVVDIDNTVFLQAILFLFLFLVLNVFLFKPWLEVRERRAKTIGGAVAEAQALRTRAGAAASEYDQRLAEAREQAMVARSDSRRAAEVQESEIVGTARREATAELDAYKRTLEQQAGEARTELGGRIDVLAGDITKQILGRSA